METKNNVLYIRIIKDLKNTVTQVGENDTRKGVGGQKKYYDQKFGKYLGYSSGAQVKRSIIERLLAGIGAVKSPLDFVLKYTKKSDKLQEDVVVATCNPLHYDMLLGGFMNVAAATTPIKRRSPFSISALIPTHPLLATFYSELGTVDRSDGINNRIIIKDEKGNELSPTEVQEKLATEDGQRVANFRKLIAPTGRISGIYEVNLAIDLDTLFKVSLREFEPELSATVEAELRADGWKEGKNKYGPCLVAPKRYKEKVIANLANALIDFRITSNQSRNFSPMPTLAVVVSTSAQKVSKTIFGKRVDADTAELTYREVEGAATFLTDLFGQYVVVETEVDAEEQAAAYITEALERACL